MQKLKILPERLKEIAISKIIFDHSEWVSLWGEMIDQGKKSRMDFLLNFDTLNKLLRLSGKTGDKIQMLLVDKIEKGIEEPSIIDLEELFNGPVTIDQCDLEVSPTWIKDETGEWKEDHTCLSIDHVSPLLEKKKQVLSAEALYKQNFFECVEVLKRSYELYLGYQEIDMDEETALQMAGLEDDLKFKMAYYAWKME